jgi:hypothetical protein
VPTAHEQRQPASTTLVPLFTLFALKALLLKALLDWEATNSNNVKGGTFLAEARGAKKLRIQ